MENFRLFLESEMTSLLTGILTDRFDRTPRLIVADWLEEHGDKDFANFIRLSAKYHQEKPPHINSPESGDVISQWVRAAKKIVSDIEKDGIKFSEKEAGVLPKSNSKVISGKNRFRLGVHHVQKLTSQRQWKNIEKSSEIPENVAKGLIFLISMRMFESIPDGYNQIKYRGADPNRYEIIKTTDDLFDKVNNQYQIINQQDIRTQLNMAQLIRFDNTLKEFIKIIPFMSKAEAKNYHDAFLAITFNMSQRNRYRVMINARQIWADIMSHLSECNKLMEEKMYS